MKSSGLDANPDFDSKLEKGKHIIDVEPSVTIATTKFQPKEPKDLEEGELLFHSHMWMKGTSLHFIVERDI
jgi:hypothetical protein